MKYVKCPTCGGHAKFVSPNFEAANILINAQKEKIELHFAHLMQHAEHLQLMLEKKIEDYTSTDLYYLFITKVQKEVIINQINLDKSYYEADIETKRLSEIYKKSLNDMNKKMLGL